LPFLGVGSISLSSRVDADAAVSSFVSEDTPLPRC
jgi:hypothetical protein